MLQTLKSLVNQLHLFTGIHTAEAEILEDILGRLKKLEENHDALAKKHDGLHTRVIQTEMAFGEHKRTHATATK